VRWVNFKKAATPKVFEVRSPYQKNFDQLPLDFIGL
jgi:hypothetical protein